jgi:hypothetical protein
MVERNQDGQATLLSGRAERPHDGSRQESEGYLRFYDPNGGIVKTWYAKRLHKFLVLYLSTQKLFDRYKVSEVQNDLMKLTIRKYRPYNW